MKKQNKFLSSIIRTSLSLIAAGLILVGCNEEDSVEPLDVSLSGTSGNAAITAFSPTDSALGFIDLITITGQNFSANPKDNVVIFQGIKENDTAQVISATPTQLVVKAPGVKDDSIRQTLKVLVAPKGANYWSSPVSYKLLHPVIRIRSYEAKISLINGMTADKNGNVYYNLKVSPNNDGIYKLSPNGTITKFAPITPGQEAFSYPSLKMGPNNEIYATRNLKGIWKISENTPIPSSVWVGGGSSGLGTINDLDFDQNKNVWAGGPANNNAVYRIRPDKNIKPFPYTASSVAAIRVYDGFLYIGGVSNDTLKKNGVWRMQIIDENTLGQVEEFVMLSGKYSAKILGLTFASDGTMFLGTDGQDFILTVDHARNVSPFYPNLVNKGIGSAALLAYTFNNFSFGDGDYLYITTSTSDIEKGKVQILKVHTQKTGAPYYGLN